MSSRVTELTLEELLADPMTRLLMTRDNLHPQVVRSVVEEAQSRLTGSGAQPTPSPARSTDRSRPNR